MATSTKKMFVVVYSISKYNWSTMKLCLLLLFVIQICSMIKQQYAWTSRQQQQRRRRQHYCFNRPHKITTTASGQIIIKMISSTQIEFQADHGRGEDHLSAFLDEGDVVMYQTGTWYVDSVEVGDGTTPKIEWAKIDNLQVVWSHNCEHGVLRGISFKEEEEEEALNINDDHDNKDNNNWNHRRRFFQVEPLDVVEFGPEQLVARVPVIWEDGQETKCRTAMPIDNDQLKSFLMVPIED
jgi:hypothetical protein